MLVNGTRGARGPTPSHFSRKAWRRWASHPRRRLRAGSPRRPWACPGKCSLRLRRWGRRPLFSRIPAGSPQPLPVLVTLLKSVGLEVMAPRKTHP